MRRSIVFAYGEVMTTVTVSPKFQVVLPKQVRDDLRLTPGQKLQVYVVDGEIRLQRPRSIKELRGLVSGLVWTEDDRDRSDRF
jgi:AbrB family looped-hinge helix DNA binding protein